MFNLGSSYFHVALTTVRHLLTVGGGLGTPLQHSLSPSLLSHTPMLCRSPSLLSYNAILCRPHCCRRCSLIVVILTRSRLCCSAPTQQNPTAVIARPRRCAKHGCGLLLPVFRGLSLSLCVLDITMNRGGSRNLRHGAVLHSSPPLPPSSALSALLFPICSHPPSPFLFLSFPLEVSSPLKPARRSGGAL